jgi:hypothetical protein
MTNDFGTRHYVMMVAFSLLAIAAMFGAGFLLEYLAGRFA